VRRKGRVPIGLCNAYDGTSDWDAINEEENFLKHHIRQDKLNVGEKDKN
jgi:hypothetical protein